MRTVEAKARNRPIKIAYLVPHEETPVNHMIVEAVFREAYTRWAGAYTLVIPTRSIGFMHSEYEAWLSSFDPDFVYTFLELDPALIRTIDKLCSPISLIRHNPQNGEPRWQSFIPDWGLYFEPISSITTVPSPYTQPTSFTPREIEPQVTIATQYAFGFKSRFMTDNFGGGFQVGGMTYGIAGLYETICLVPPELPKNNFAGNSRCTSLADMLTNINLRKAIPVAVYAMAHSEAISTVQPYRWTRSFNLFIGSTVLDRIHFWNARHFTPRHAAGCLGSLILEADVLNDGDLVAQLGKYLDNHNFSGHISSPAQVSIRSYSHSEQELHPIKELLQKHTYNSVFVNSEFNLPAIPAIEDFQEPYVQFIEPVESSTLKLTEKNNTLAAKEPSHFMYVPPRHRGLARGQWIIELDIERHNSSSKYSNINSWVLPTRRQLIGAFTDNLGKVTKNHRLAVLPITKGFHTSRQSINKDYFFSLTLPDDETFFQHLLLDGCRYTQHDLRLLNAKVGYRNLTISDKGQNLRGVVSMFDNLTIAHEVLTIRFWREVLRAAKVESVKHLIFTRKQLEGFLPNDQATLDILRRELDWSDPKKVTQYLKSNLTDTLEYLVSINVFFCVHQWRCRYCGHTNSRTFDNMRIKNVCEICSTDYLAPLDIEWAYQLNEFVFRSLVTHTGLPVLWTLGFLQNRFGNESFWYLPEVDLHENSDEPGKKKEIDILCVGGGRFIAVEVKLSARQLLQKPHALDRFVEKMNTILPDVAMISCERYCELETDREPTKSSLVQALEGVKKRLDESIELQLIVSTDVDGFNEHSAELGWVGERTERIWQIVDVKRNDNPAR